MRRSNNSPLNMSGWFDSLEDDVSEPLYNDTRKSQNFCNENRPPKLPLHRHARDTRLEMIPYGIFHIRAKTGRDDPLWTNEGSSNNNEDDPQRYREEPRKKPRDQDHIDGLPYSTIVVRNAKDLTEIAYDEYLWWYARTVVPPLAVELTRKEISNIQQYYGSGRTPSEPLGETESDVIRAMEILQGFRKMKAKAVTIRESRYLLFMHTKESVFSMFGGVKYYINDGKPATINLDGPNIAMFNPYVHNFRCHIITPSVNLKKSLNSEQKSFCRTTEYYRKRIWGPEDEATRLERRDLSRIKIAGFSAGFWSVKTRGFDDIFAEDKSEGKVKLNANLLPTGSRISIPWTARWTASVANAYKSLSRLGDGTMLERILEAKIDVIIKKIRAEGGRDLLSVDSPHEYGEYLEHIRLLVFVAGSLGMQRIVTKYSAYKEEHDSIYLHAGETFENSHQADIQAFTAQLHEEYEDDINDEIGRLVMDDQGQAASGMGIGLDFEFTLPKEFSKSIPLLLIGDRRKAAEWIAE